MTRRGISTPGRAALAGAVVLDRDWSLPYSSVDRLVEQLGGLSDDDLESVRLLAGHIDEAATVLLLRRQGAQ